MKVKYWLTFNEINVSTISPLLGAGVLTPKSKLTMQDIYQTAHHQLVASALVTKLAKEIDKTLRIGCMVASAPRYPMSCRPEDMLNMMKSQQELDYFIHVHCNGNYPYFAKRFFKENNITLDFRQEDREILKNTVDFISFSYYNSKVVAADESLYQTAGGNLMRGLKNPFVSYSEYDYPIDPKGLRYVLNYLYDHFQKPLFVAENGLGSKDTLTVSDSGDLTVKDDYRIEFHKAHINEKRSN